MKCPRCKKDRKSVNLPYTNICMYCFSYSIEKRVRKLLRTKKYFKKGDNILVTDKLSLYFIERILKDLPVRIFLRKTLNKEFIRKNKINKILIKRTLDDIDQSFLENLFYNKNKKPEYLSILYLTDKEAGLFSRINRIPFKPNKKNKKIKKFLDNLEKKYPEIRFSLAKNAKI